MGSHGIRDRVAIVGMGCTPFGEHWTKSADDLLVDAAGEAFSSAGVNKDDVDAFWLGTAQSGMSGITLARPLQVEGKPVTRVENFCASGSEALRQAAYAVVQRNAMKVWEEDRDFRALLAQDPAVKKLLDPKELAECFDLDRQLRHVDAVFERVLGK